LVVPSQRYSFELVEQAIERNAIVVLMRSSSLWLPAVPALATYRRLLRVRSVQNPTISESNLSEGFRELVDAIRDTPRARGRIEVVVDSVRSAAPRSESARAIGEFNRKGVKGMSNEMDAAGRDITRFRVRLGSQIRDELPKRRVMLEIARYLVAVGIPPDAVAAKMVGRRANQRWFKVPSKHDGPSFVRAALALERSFDPHRWFVDSDELVTFGGDTFALSNQWGSKTFPPTIDSFERAFSFHGLEVTPRP
jgi:hypothetical protein